jgi:hypothetical protein
MERYHPHDLKMYILAPQARSDFAEWLPELFPKTPLSLGRYL